MDVARITALVVLLRLLACSDLLAADASPEEELARGTDQFQFRWQATSRPSTAPGWQIEKSDAHDRIDCLRSGRLKAAEECAITISVTGPARLSFWWRVDSQPGADQLALRVDNKDARVISGRQDWARVEQEIPTGKHAVAWVYRKDAGIDVGDDSAWLDEVEVSGPREIRPDVQPGKLDDDPWTLRFPTIAGRRYRVEQRPMGSLAPWQTLTVKVPDRDLVELIEPSFVARSREYQVSIIEPPSFRVLPPPEIPDAVTGRPTRLTAEADGSSPITYRWFRRPLPAPGEVGATYVPLKTATAGTWEVVQASPSDAGDYKVEASNEAGVEFSPPIRILVHDPPTQVRVEGSLAVKVQGSTEATGIAVDEGKKVVLIASAAGEPPMTFRWRRQRRAGEPLAEIGDGARLALDPVGPNDAGLLVVQAVNRWGEAASLPVPLTVRLRARIGPAPERLRLRQGDQVTLQIEASGDPPISYRWFRDGRIIPGQTESNYLCDTSEAGEWKYRVQVNNPLGIAATSDDIRVEVEPWSNARVDSIGLDLVAIPGGRFTMGTQAGDRDDEKPPRLILVSRSYKLGATEITEKQWRALFPEADAVPERDSLPHTCSHDDAVRFCVELTRRERERETNPLPPDLEYALPTEAQWERACRLGGEEPLDEVAWYFAGEEGKGDSFHPVATKRANRLGVFDLLGNAWEWTADRYGRYDPRENADPTGIPDDAPGEIFRSLRGGSSQSSAERCRPSARHFDRPGSARPTYGFRVVLKPVADGPLSYRLNDPKPGSAKETPR